MNRKNIRHTVKKDKNNCYNYSTTCLKRPFSKRPKVIVYWFFVTFPRGILGQIWYLIVSFPDLCILSYFSRPRIALCRSKVLQNASAILSTFIKLTFIFKIFVLSIFEWPIKTGFTVLKHLWLVQVEYCQ